MVLLRKFLCIHLMHVLKDSAGLSIDLALPIAPRNRELPDASHLGSALWHANRQFLVFYVEGSRVT
jgi:hypothetical protein